MPIKTNNLEKPTEVPDLPWSDLASDLFEWEYNHNLITTDYYSKFIEVDRVMVLSSSTIDALKSQISGHSIPDILRTDNGPQYASRESTLFYGIQRVTSSPKFP